MVGNRGQERASLALGAGGTKFKTRDTSFNIYEVVAVALLPERRRLAA